jgi:hypothetical protein
METESPLERVEREAFERAGRQIRIDVEAIRRRGCIHCHGPLGTRYLYCSARCSRLSLDEERKLKQKKSPRRGEPGEG